MSLPCTGINVLGVPSLSFYHINTSTPITKH